MEITPEQYEKIKDSLPLQRGNVRLTNLQILNAILYVAEQGCKWRRLPRRFGNWHTIYVRMNRSAKNGVLDRVFERLQSEQIVRIQIEAFASGLDFGEGASGWHRGVKKNGPQAIGKSRGGWTTKIHLIRRECSNGHHLRSLAGQCSRRSAGTGLAKGTWADAGWTFPADGQSLRG